VQSTGFGAFWTAKRKPRKSFNPKSREPIKIPTKTAAQFYYRRTTQDAARQEAGRMAAPRNALQ
jgi:nucleoid DNA-binding protein